MSSRPLSSTVRYLLPALTMALGWGLRGHIGGGPLGAMIPGAMIALVLCLLLDRDGEETGLIAAFSAVGIGFGGQETYGQTVGLSIQPETFWWAILGFFVKGAVWGLLGGAVLGWALSGDARKRPRMDVIIGLGLMLAATYLGWKVVNEPKLIYFSNPHDKPRPEIWAGLLFGGVALLAWLNRKGVTASLPFAVWGTLSGGAGFALGAAFNALGRWYGHGLEFDWWKLMEYTFGFLLGLGFAIAAERAKALVTTQSQSGEYNANKSASTALETKQSQFALLTGAVAWAAALVLAGIGLEYKLDTQMTFSIAGALLIVAAVVSEMAAWQVAISVTACAFFLDLLEEKTFQADPWAIAITVLATAVVAIVTARRASAFPMFQFLTWAAVGVSLIGTLMPWPAGKVATITTQGIFVAMAVICTLWVFRLRQERGFDKL